MSAAPQMTIVHRWTGARERRALDREVMVIGRRQAEGDGGEAPDIALDSRMVSDVHAILRRSQDGEWMIRHAGNNEIRLDDEVMPPRSERPLAPNQELRIGEFLLSITQVVEAERSEELESGESHLSEVERQIHDALLAKMNSYAGATVFDLDDPATHQRVEQDMEEVIEQAVGRLGSAELELLTRVAVYRHLSYQLLASGSRGTGDNDGHGVPPRPMDPAERQLHGIEQRMARAMGLSFDKGNMEQEVATLDRSFELAIKENTLDFSPGLKIQAVQALIRNDIHQLVFSLGPLQDFLDMDCVSEIMVVSQDQIYIEKFGVVEDSRRAFPNRSSLMKVIERIVEPINRRVNVGSPVVDARLMDGSRVNIVIPPLAIKGPCVTIRKFAETPLTVEDLVGFGALSEQFVRFLRAAVESRKNVFISGGTGTGKTTLLNCLSRFIPRKERIVTIEDTAELQLQQRHVVTLEARPKNVEGKGEITISDLVRNALRMRPDRIIVGECRGAEAMDMLKAMNTGHEGSMATGHANSPSDMMLRLETMILEGSDMPVSAIRSQIASALDLVVQLRRFPSGARCVSHITEVREIDEDSGEIILQDAFLAAPGADGAMRFRHTGYVPSFIEQLLREGDVTLEAFF